MSVTGSERFASRAGGIRGVFAQAADTYEVTNRALTFGLDLLWRAAAVRVALRRPARIVVDMCTGTGETAACLRRHLPPGTLVVGCDFSLPMLSVARTKPEAGAIRFIVADAGALPLRDGTVDLMTMSFAARNLRTTDEAFASRLSEFVRVLATGGRFVNVETSRPAFPPLRWGLRAYVALVVARLGTLISGSRVAYAYLASTIPRFHGARQFSSVLGAAGFSSVRFRRLSLGIAAIHEAVK